MNAVEVHRIQEVYRREYRSLLQYAREASPFASGADRLVRDAVVRFLPASGSSSPP